jgi:ribonuclease P protein subunit RPR2
MVTQRMSMRNRSRNRRIARERIDILLNRAAEVFPRDRAKADRYAELAKKIAKRHALRFPRRWKRRVCKKCYAFLVPGVSSRVRIYKGRVIITCLKCGHVVRLPISKV